MAEGLLKKKLGDVAGVTPEDLEKAGFRITSAGIAAMPGGGPATEAVDVMQDSGIEISDHRSQPLSDRMVNEADLILTMTTGHRQMVLAQWPTAGNRVHVLGREQGDVFDPIGMPMEYYEACAQQIDHHLAWWISEFPLFKNSNSKGKPE
jgi:protein-tyrosine phosphatase